ncbi:MAG: recombinase RecT [Synergistaceae bacterium]|nr:recombinase RecT [Synergistaceae bacterium]
MENRTENNNALAAQNINNGGSVNLFAFTNIDRAWQFASVLSKSEIIPDTFKGNAASCLIALDMANRMKRNPFEVMQAMYVVHGKPGFSSSFLIGLINSCGLFERLRFEYVGEQGTESWGCRAWTKDKATGEKLTGTLVTMKMAKAEGWTNNKKWMTMPETMLMYRAASFFSRMYCPDLTSGMHTADELSDADMQDTPSAVAQPDSRTVSPSSVTMEQIMNAPAPANNGKSGKTKELEPAMIEAPLSPSQDAVAIPEPEQSQLSFDVPTPRTHGLIPLELMRQEVQKLMGPEPEGLGLRPDEQEEYLARITGKRDIKEIPEAELKKVVNAARDELMRRFEDGR